MPGVPDVPGPMVPAHDAMPWYARLWRRRSLFSMKAAGSMWAFIAIGLVVLFVADGPRTVGVLTPLLFAWSVFAAATLFAAHRYHATRRPGDTSEVDREGPGSAGGQA